MTNAVSEGYNLFLILTRIDTKKYHKNSPVCLASGILFRFCFLCKRRKCPMVAPLVVYSSIKVLSGHRATLKICALLSINSILKERHFVELLVKQF